MGWHRQELDRDQRYDEDSEDSEESYLLLRNTAGEPWTVVACGKAVTIPVEMVLAEVAAYIRAHRISLLESETTDEELLGLRRTSTPS